MRVNETNNGKAAPTEAIVRCQQVLRRVKARAHLHNLRLVQAPNGLRLSRFPRNPFPGSALRAVRESRVEVPWLRFQRPISCQNCGIPSAGQILLTRGNGKRIVPGVMHNRPARLTCAERCVGGTMPGVRASGSSRIVCSPTQFRQRLYRRKTFPTCITQIRSLVTPLCKSAIQDQTRDPFRVPDRKRNGDGASL